MNSATFELREPWSPLNEEQAEPLLREAQREISPGHLLHGLSLVPIACSRLADDALCKLDDSRVTDASHLEPQSWTAAVSTLPGVLQLR